jgi:hypothetical protein
MKNCDAIQESVGAWLDGELGLRDAEAVRAHTNNCPSCAEHKRRLERLQSSLHSALESGASQIAYQTFWAGVERRISEERPWSVEIFDWVRSALPARRLAWAAPLAILVFVAFLSVNRYFPGEETGSPQGNFTAVESIDAHGFNVAILRESETKTTVIWLFQIQEGDDESSREPDRASHSF